MEPVLEIMERIRQNLKKENCDTAEQSFECPICKDTGLIRVMIDGTEYFKKCQCMTEKINRQRLKNSGLESVIDRYSFDNYRTAEGWQRTVKEKAEAYAKNPEGWFFIGGQSGSGKTHICTAICGELIKNKRVRYMPWVTENIRLKANRLNDDEYNRQMNVWKTADVLYIDDFFKTRNGVPVTGADLMTAYEILNYRYMQAKGTTIISSELSCDEIMDIDSAVGGRIYEKTRDNMLFISGSEKNFRIRSY